MRSFAALVCVFGLAIAGPALGADPVSPPAATDATKAGTPAKPDAPKTVVPASPTQPPVAKADAGKAAESPKTDATPQAATSGKMDSDIAVLKEKFPALKLTRKPDGTLMVDERFALKGKGTKDEPYLVTWDQLTSTSEVYDPRKGQKKIPDRVQMLDDTYVTLTGYIAFPLYVKEPTELLSMLNQWDGCCIGIPPTPYDAVEVHLKDAANRDERMANFGTVTGKLSVKPYLVGDWLVGLFVMEEGQFSKPKQGGSGS